MRTFKHPVWLLALVGLLVLGSTPFDRPAHAGTSGQLYLPLMMTSTAALALTVAPEVDASRATSATIPLTGGSLTATGADGTQYQLTIPNASLLVTTTITMQPLTSISGLPAGGGPVLGVQLAPEGLMLFQPATLTIVPATPIPLNNQYTFGYYTTGSDFHGEPRVPDPSRIALELAHFSGYGVGNFLANVQDALAQFLGGGAEAQLQNRLNSIVNQMVRGQISQSLGFDELTSALRGYFINQVLPQLQAATTNDALLNSSVQTYLNWERGVTLFGLQSRFTNEFNQASTAIQAAVQFAYNQAFNRCVNNADPSQIQKIIHYAQMAQLLGFPNITSNYVQLLDQCEHFELDVDSVIQTGTFGIQTTSSHVTSVIPVAISPAGQLSGTGGTQYPSFTFQYLDGCTDTAASIVNTSQLVLTMTLSFDAQSTPAVSLGFYDGIIQEKIHMVCPGYTADATMTYWQTAFEAAHKPEVQNNPFCGSQCFTLTGWTPGIGVFVQKTYDDSGFDASTGLQYTEHTTFQLHHVPQKTAGTRTSARRSKQK